MAKKEKTLTKRERKAQVQKSPSAVRQAAPRHAHSHAHIHCIACGKHLEPEWFGEPDGADFIRCEHGTDHPHCVGCFARAQALVQEHDRTNQPVRKTAAWH